MWVGKQCSQQRWVGGHRVLFIWMGGLVHAFLGLVKIPALPSGIASHTVLLQVYAWDGALLLEWDSKSSRSKWDCFGDGRDGILELPRREVGRNSSLIRGKEQTSPGRGHTVLWRHYDPQNYHSRPSASNDGRKNNCRSAENSILIVLRSVSVCSQIRRSLDDWAVQ